MNHILDDLTPQQRAAATKTGPTLVIAGAGTGKTKTLTAAVADRVIEHRVSPNRIIAVTFTNKAAAEMSGRIRAALGEEMSPSWVGTFHGLGARQLRIEPEAADLRPGFDIFDADDSRRVVKRVMKAMNLAAGDDETIGARDPLKLVCNRISRWKDELVAPREAPSAAETQIAEAIRDGFPIDADGLRTAARIYAEYQHILRDANAADFGDLLLWPVRALMHDAAYRERWAGRFDRVLTDEYQDVNRAQFTWLRYLCSRHHEIFAVGDDDQSIFGWRGADITYIRRFTQHFPGATQIRLEENFRSTGHILAAANAVIERDQSRLGKTLFTRKPPGTPIELVRFNSGEAEAVEITKEIVRRRAEGASWGDFAVLYRSNSLSRLFEESLMRGRVPYTIIGDVGFYQRAEIKDSLALLRLVAMPDDRQADESFRRVINTPARGFGPKAMTILEQEAAWRRVSLLQALETAQVPPKARAGGLALRRRHSQRRATASINRCRPAFPRPRRDGLSQDAAREPGRDHGGAPRQRAGADPARRRFPQPARTPRSRRARNRRSRRGCHQHRQADDAASSEGPGIRPCLPCRLGERAIPAKLWRPERRAQAGVCRNHARNAAGDHLPLQLPARTKHTIGLPQGHTRGEQSPRLGCPTKDVSWTAPGRVGSLTAPSPCHWRPDVERYSSDLRRTACARLARGI